MNILFSKRSACVLASLTIAVLFNSQLNGQVAIQAVTPARAVVVESSTSVSASSPDAAATSTSEDGQPTEPEKPFDERRIEALLKANIDRSLPTVLKQWSAKEKTEEESNEKSTTKKEKAHAAKVANIYEDFVVLEFEKKPPFKKDEKFEVHLNEELIGLVAILSVEENKVSGKFEAVEAVKEEAEEKASDSPDTVKKAETKESPAAKDASKDGVDDSAKEETESTSETAEETNSDDKQTAKADDAASDSTEKSETSEEEPSKETAAAKPWSSLKADVAVTAKKPDDGSAKKAAEEAQIQSEVAQWSKMITLGKWTEVKTFLASMKEDDADKLYAHLLTKLSSVPGAKNENRGGSLSLIHI